MGSGGPGGSDLWRRVWCQVGDGGATGAAPHALPCHFHSHVNTEPAGARVPRLFWFSLVSTFTTVLTLTQKILQTLRSRGGPLQPSDPGSENRSGVYQLPPPGASWDFWDDLLSRERSRHAAREVSDLRSASAGVSRSQSPSARATRSTSSDPVCRQCEWAPHTLPEAEATTSSDGQSSSPFFVYGPESNPGSPPGVAARPSDESVSHRESSPARGMSFPATSSQAVSFNLQQKPEPKVPVQGAHPVAVAEITAYFLVPIPPGPVCSSTTFFIE